MTLRGFVLVLALLVPSAAIAGPFSLNGAWSSTSTLGDPLALNAVPFWAGASWDGPHLGVGDLIDASNTAGLEYLHDGTGNYTSFRFDEAVFDITKLFGITARTRGRFGLHDGAFTYDNGSGKVWNSWDDPGQFALFRLVGANSTRYFLGIEDILVLEMPNDRDYNDYVATFTTNTQPVPEPGTLLLLGSGIAALAARRKMSARKARTATTV